MSRVRLIAFVLGMAGLAGPVWGDTVTLTPLDGAAESDGGAPWTIDPASNTLLAQRITAINLYRRGVMEFPLGAIPAGVTVLSATFSGEINVLSGPPDPQIEFHGYAGDGVLEGADATQPFNQVGISPVATAPAVLDIPIDTAFVQSLVGTGAHVGLYTYAVFEGPQYGIASVEYAQISGMEPPALTVEYIPEPATFGLVALGGLALLRRRNEQR